MGSFLFAQEEYDIDPSKEVMKQMSRFDLSIDVDLGKEIFFWTSEMVDLASFRLIRELERLSDSEIKSISPKKIRVIEFLLKTIVDHGKADHLMQVLRITDLAGQKLFYLPQYLGSERGFFFGHKPSTSIHHQLLLKTETLTRMITNKEVFERSVRFDISKGVLLDAEQIEIARSCMKFFGLL